MTVQKLIASGESKKSPEEPKKKPKPGDVRVVNINGQPTVLIIGREYKFRLKDGCSPRLNVNDEPRP
jgi:hypothetical protein